MNFKRIFSIETNFFIKNFSDFLKKDTITNFSHNKKIILMDAASYNNIGDQAISEAIKTFIIDNFSDYQYVEISEKDIVKYLSFLKKNLSFEDIICLNGGGNMGDIYPRYEAIRRKIIKLFPNNKIFIFPQTIDYSNTIYGLKELKKSKKIYNKDNVFLLARENRTFDIMKRMYKNVFLFPDIVFYLYGTIQHNICLEDIVGVCLRNDKESILNSEMKYKIANSFEKNGFKIQYLSTISNMKLIDSNNRKKIILSKIDEFKKCKYIITDRLHGMIFSILCNVPCLVFDNSNKKISGVLNVVKDYIKNVKILNEWNENEVFDFFDEIKTNSFDKNKEFSELRDLIRKQGEIK